MGSSGLEPPTSRLSGARSNLLSYEPPTGLDPCSHLFQLGYGFTIQSSAVYRLLWILRAPLLRFCACPVKAIGFPSHFRDGDDGIRTHDPLLAGQVLSQLSYTPMLVTHRPLICSSLYNELLNDSLAQRFSLCQHDSLKIEQQHSFDSYLIPSWYSNQPFSLERR